jgi:ATP-dependent DNA ligase
MELIDLSKTFPPEIILVPTRICNSLDDVLAAYEIYISQGYEGIVVRHVDNLYIPRRSTYVMKFKPKKSDIYEIVEVKEATALDGTGKKMVGSLLCRTRGTSDVFSVSPGVGCNEERKKTWWKERDKLVGRNVFIEYQNLTAKRKVPRFGRFPFDKNIWLEIK